MRKSLMYPHILYVVSASDACTCAGKYFLAVCFDNFCFLKFANFPFVFK
jgi:hypothetical protein